MAVSDRLRRLRLVGTLRANGSLRSPRVAAALVAVPRSRFVPPGTATDAAYDDRALVLATDGDDQPTSTLSQPSMVALMLEQLRAEPRHRVLEVGTASGYTAALLAELVRPHGQVVTVELDPELAATAAARLAPRWPEVTVRCGDGWSGVPEAAPFDRVHVTVGVDDLSPHWVEQLTDGGVLVAPVTLRPGVELSVAFERRGGVLVSRSVQPCGFVRLRGPHADPSRCFRVPGMGQVFTDWAGPQEQRTLRSVLACAPTDGDQVPRVPEGWLVRLAFEQPHPLAVLTPPPRTVLRVGLHDPGGGGVALLERNRLVGYGDSGALRILRRWLAAADPLSPLSLGVVARPSTAPPGGSGVPAHRRDGGWTVHRRHFSYTVRPG